jgi:AAA15 family ATPase/GTPase
VTQLRLPDEVRQAVDEELKDSNSSQVELPGGVRLIANVLRYSSGRPSQLIVTTHETTLLRRDFLRPDEIWLIENRPGRGSRLVSLAEYKLADSKDLQQDYLQGRFGGVPVLDDFSWLGGPHAKGT